MSTWENLVTDPQVQLGELIRNPSLKDFVEETLPRLLDDMLSRALTVNTLMEAQFRCADYFVDRGKKFRKIKRSLSQYEHADFFLETIGVSVKQYCQTSPGLTDTEFELMQSGKWTVRDLLENRPAVIMAPLLKHLIMKN